MLNRKYFVKTNVIYDSYVDQCIDVSLNNHLFNQK